MNDFIDPKMSQNHVMSFGFSLGPDLFNTQIQNSRFQFIPSQGTYFQNLDYSAIRPDLNDIDMCQFLAEQHKIVAIPISVFYQQAPESLRLIRFCFAKTDQTLQRAGAILAQC